jgi:hypothetical protein
MTNDHHILKCSAGRLFAHISRTGGEVRFWSIAQSYGGDVSFVWADRAGRVHGGFERLSANGASECVIHRGGRKEDDTVVNPIRRRHISCERYYESF